MEMAWNVILAQVYEPCDNNLAAIHHKNGLILMYY